MLAKNAQYHHPEDDFNLVEIWLRKDPTRWIAGFLGGLIAGALALTVAGLFSMKGNEEFWFPAKLMSTIVMGPAGAELGFQLKNILTGIVVIEAICIFWGMIFAHFTGTNRFCSLLGMGFVWGTFSWIFVWNLFLQSFRIILPAQVSPGPLFFICLTYGFSLSIVGWIHPLVGGPRKSL